MEGTPFGHYRLLSLVGQGGMGRVYRAYDTLTDRVVALKVLPEESAQDPNFKQRFLREAQLAARLTDPHVVPIHRFGELDGRLYLDMRLIEGRDLQTELSVVGALDPQRTVAIIDQIAAALEAAHAAGLVHRDVKPSNILLTATDFAYLIDFGIARGGDQTVLTSTGSMIGTLAYMAPERFQTGEADARSDVYALTCVLFECLAGQLAFPGKSLEQQIAAHLFADPPRVSDFTGQVPQQINEVVLTGLAKSPADRYQSCAELASALTSALTTSDVRVTPAAPSIPVREETQPASAWAATLSRSPPVADVVEPGHDPQPPHTRPAGKRRWPAFAGAAAAIVVMIAALVVILGDPSDRKTGAGPTTSSTTSSRTSPTVERVESIAATLPAEIAASGKLIVGVNIPYAPNEFKDPSGKIIGFDVDLMNAIAGTLGLTAEYRESDFAKIIPSIQGGTYNVGMSSFTDTKEREASVDFVTYFSAGTLWAQRPGSPIDPNNACGKKVAVQATTYQDTYELPAKNTACIDAGRPAIEIVSFDGQDAAANAVMRGQVDAMSADSPLTAYAIKQSNGKLEAAGEVFDAAPYGWPVQKGSPLAQSLQKALEHLIESGKYEEIAKNWGVENGMIDKPVINGATS